MLMIEFGPIAFLITFFGTIGLIFLYLNWVVYKKNRKKNKHTGRCPKSIC